MGAFLLDPGFGRGQDEERIGAGAWRCPPAETLASCMGLSSAAWGLGGVRLISGRQQHIW